MTTKQPTPAEMKAFAEYQVALDRLAALYRVADHTPEGEEILHNEYAQVKRLYLLAFGKEQI